MKVDRQFSYGKIDFQLKQNNRQEKAHQIHQLPNREYTQNQSSVLENIGSALGGMFDIQPSGTGYDPDEAEFLRQLKKKKKERGFRL